jgi:histidinol-phosphate aminotransferase
MGASVSASDSVGPPVGARIRLSSNESPFGPSPAAVDAAQRALVEAHRYPDDQSVALRQAIAAHEGVAFDQVAVGTGSAALLMDAVPHLCSAGDEVLAFAHSFIVYRLATANAGATYVEVADSGPATAAADSDGYGRDVDALLAAITDSTRVILIDNPGNPTGTHLSGEQLRALVAGVPEDITIGIDEAYHHFATGQRGYATVAELGLSHPRVLTMRTFSKAYALAGLRVGYVIGPADIIAPMDARRPRFNVTTSAQAAAIASLDDTDHLKTTVEGTRVSREQMAAGLRELGVPFTDGLGNFLTVECGTDAAPIVDAYGTHGVGVRGLVPYGMNEQFRATVGTTEETEEFLKASATVLADVPSRR